MLKNIYLLLIFILGFFLTPSVTYACSKSSNNVAKECSIRELNKEKSHQKHIRDVKNNQCEKDHPCKLTDAPEPVLAEEKSPLTIKFVH